jgi:hypothetical protein
MKEAIKEGNSHEEDCYKGEKWRLGGGETAIDVKQPANTHTHTAIGQLRQRQVVFAGLYSTAKVLHRTWSLKMKYCTENQNWLSRLLTPQIEIQHVTNRANDAIKLFSSENFCRVSSSLVRTLLIKMSFLRSLICLNSL